MPNDIKKKLNSITSLIQRAYIKIEKLSIKWYFTSIIHNIQDEHTIKENFVQYGSESSISLLSKTHHQRY